MLDENKSSLTFCYFAGRDGCSSSVHSEITTSIELKGKKNEYSNLTNVFLSASSSFQRELRWLIEKVHPINQTWSVETLQKSHDMQIWKTRNAFAAAERAIGKSLGKRSLSRNFLKRVTSIIKEKEDSSIKSRGKMKWYIA